MRNPASYCDGVVGAGDVASSTAHAGDHAGRLDVHDGVRRVRLAGRRTYLAQIRHDARPTDIQVVVVCDLVFVQRHHTRNTHDHHIRSCQSGQHVINCIKLQKTITNT